MELKTYLTSLSKDQLEELASMARVTPGHLRNVKYGERECSPELACAVELFAGGAVRRWECRPADWYRIWTELIGADGSPEIPAPYAKLVSGQLAQA
jgi:DNA-binding transcriptional regulator YdaS (Cro superfamily)